MCLFAKEVSGLYSTESSNLSGSAAILIVWNIQITVLHVRAVSCLFQKIQEFVKTIGTVAFVLKTGSFVMKGTTGKNFRRFAIKACELMERLFLRRSFLPG